MDSVITVFAAVSEKLNTVWDEVGLSGPEREAQIASLHKDLEIMLQGRLKNEENLRDQYVIESQDIEKEITRLGTRLGADRAELVAPAPAAENLTRKLTWLRTVLKGTQDKCAEREKHFNGPLGTIHGVWTELGCEFEPEFAEIGHDLSDERLAAFEAKARAVGKARVDRCSAIDHEVARLKALFEELEMGSAGGLGDGEGTAQPVCSFTELDRKIVDGSDSLGISWQILDALASRAEDLESEKQRRQTLLKDLGNIITPLWDKLQIPLNEREGFFAKNVGIGVRVIRHCEDEVTRLRALKKQNIMKLIGNAQDAIRVLWGELGTAEGDRIMPQSDEQSEANDHVLEACESLIADLERDAEAIRPILKSISKREECIKAREEFEQSQSDRSRLGSRGGELTKQLFREEKLQKKMKLLPKVTGRIRGLIRTWQKEHKQMFLYNGAPFLDSMDSADAARTQLRKEREAARKAAKIEKMTHERQFGTKAPPKKKSGRRRKAHTAAAVPKASRGRIGRKPASLGDSTNQLN